MKEPTQEQIREFWEWCRFKQLPCGNKNYHYERGAKVMDWRIPSGELIPFLPRIDLNNLFKYVLPKLKDKGHQVEILGYRHGYRATIYENSFTQDGAGNFDPCLQPKSQVDNKDPALALFWAIWEVIKENDVTVM